MRNKKIVIFILVFLFFSRLVLTLFGFYACKTCEKKCSVSSLKSLSQVWLRWDSGWYKRIAKEWYHSKKIKKPYREEKYAFFPLYPLFVRFFHLFLRDWNWSLILASNFFFFLALYFFYLLYGKEALKFLILWPTSFLLSGGFTESLFLFLAILSFYFLKKKNFLGAGLSGFLLGLTKPQGGFFFLVLILSYFSQKRFKIEKDFIFCFLPILGTFHYFWYLFYLTGDFFVWFKVETAWEHKFTFPWNFYNEAHLKWPNLNFNLWFSLFLFFLFLFSFRFLSLNEKFYGILFLILPFFYKPLIPSLFRYEAVLFPAPLIFSRISQKNKFLGDIFSVSFPLLQGGLFYLWICQIKYAFII